MNISRPFSVCLVLSLCAGVQAQQQAATLASKPAKMPYYIDTMILDAKVLLPPPPAVDSDANKAELEELHRIEQTGTPEQVAKAKADDNKEDMFVRRWG